MPNKPPLDPDVADEAPQSPILTGYDEEHFVTYLRLLDAAADDADWREVARVVLHIGSDQRSSAHSSRPPLSDSCVQIVPARNRQMLECAAERVCESGNRGSARGPGPGGLPSTP